MDYKDVLGWIMWNCWSLEVFDLRKCQFPQVQPNTLNNHRLPMKGELM